MEHLLILFSEYRFWGYLAVGVGMILEGDAVLFIAAFLTEQDFFNPYYMALTVFGSVLFGDTLWYCFGVWLDSKKNVVNRWAHGIAKPFEKGLMSRPLRTLLISKFTYGFHHPILMRAGSLKMKYSEFLWHDIKATLVWMLIVGGLGFFSGTSFVAIKKSLKVAELGLFFVLVAFFAVWHFIINRSRKELSEPPAKS